LRCFSSLPPVILTHVPVAIRDGAPHILGNLEDLASAFARILNGTTASRSDSNVFISSEFDAWFNQAFTNGTADAEWAADLLDERPGFVWLSREPRFEEKSALAARGFEVEQTHFMVADTDATSAPRRPIDRSWTVASYDDFERWHSIYCSIFDADPRGRNDWAAVVQALGPTGNSTLVLLLAGLDEEAVSIAAMYLSHDEAGLYCFGTLPDHRAHGYATELVERCHVLCRQRGVKRATLESSAMGVSVYTNCGYRNLGPIYAAVSPDRLDASSS
jgi:GNAT superfamily N-acetyltransferase